jgi:4-amino-4-deoxy-L-arabinose transferase-like glycosyltransferase
MFLAAAVYLLLAFAHLELPGLQYDETLFTNAALGNVYDGTFIEWQVRPGSTEIPLMLMPYLGATKAFLYAPLFALFGGGAAVVRIPVILIGLTSLGLLYLLLRSLFDQSVALLGFVVLALDPTFIFSNKLDWGPVAIRLALRVASLLFLWRWLDGGRLRMLALAGFCLGLGIYDKIIFAWFLVALAAALLVCGRTVLARRVRTIPALVGTAAFLLGAAPLIAYNICVPLGTVQRHRSGERAGGSTAGARYRYDLFRTTLNGTAILDMVNGSEPEVTAASVSERTGSPIRRGLGWLLRTAAITGTPGFYFAVASAAGLFVFSVARRKKRILFFVVLTAAESLLIALTPEATGTHHAVSVFPFSQVLVAIALVELYRTGPRLRVAAVALGGFLLCSQLTAGVAYVKSLGTTGGTGKWSDAIYRLHDFARSREDRPLFLMDWGFGNQLLTLSGGNIRAEEAFVPITLQQTAEQKVRTMYPYLLTPRALFVFHMPKFESYPMFDVFQSGLKACGLEGRVVQSFAQRDGRPVYVVCEAVFPEIEEHLRAGRYFQYLEAEQTSRRQGGGVEFRGGASSRRMLGELWGRNPGDFASWNFKATRRVDNVRLHLRYAFDAPRARACDVLIDGKALGRLSLPWSGNIEGQQDNWNWVQFPVGTLQAGCHELTLKPDHTLDYTNLDALYFAEGELQLRPFSLVAGRQFEPSINLDVLGYQGRSDVSLESSSSDLVAGKSMFVLRIVNLPVSAIDVQYTLDGKRMPLIYDWRLDPTGAAIVPVSGSTAKGVYRFVAIRDAANPSPTGWIRVDATVRVR